MAHMPLWQWNLDIPKMYFREKCISPHFANRSHYLGVCVCVSLGLEGPAVMSKAGGSFKMCFTAISDLQSERGGGDQLLESIEVSSK